MPDRQEISYENAVSIPMCGQLTSGMTERRSWKKENILNIRSKGKKE
jgi:hypothetical protein